MDKFELNSFRHIHFVGVGGVSMHSLAIYCKDLGMAVSGSDVGENKYIKNCKQYGIKIYNKHRKSNIDGADLIIYTGAVGEHNVEVIQAHKRGIKVLDRAELLAHICKNYKYVIGVSGTHGKSTTCAMIYHILHEAGQKVSCHIGADIDNAKLNPADDFLVLECCEYNRSFLKFKCDLGVVLNIENDHLDCYENMYNLKTAFITFIKGCKEQIVFDIPSTKCIKSKKAIRVNPCKNAGYNTFNYENKKYMLSNAYGQHNINNATVAIAVCEHLGISYSKIYKALKTFKPAGRRCEMLGKWGGCDIITDYAHHPTEIQALYNSLKERYNEAYIIFQPHTYSRTKLLRDDFVKVLSSIDNIIIYKEYPAREHKGKGIGAKDLAMSIKRAEYCKNYFGLKKELCKIKSTDKTCIAFVGAGDIDMVAKRFIKETGSN